MKPGKIYLPWASISLAPDLATGLFFSSISNPGYPTFLILVIMFFSITMSTGPVGGAPLPFISVAPLIIN